MNPFIIVITYTSGAQDFLPYRRFVEALDYCQNKISYSGGKVKRVEIDSSKENGGLRALWDSSWDFQSQIAALYWRPLNNL